MGASKTDWIQIERDYRETGLSYRKLAEKYGVSLSSLKKIAAKNKWSSLKAFVGTKGEPEPAPSEPGEPAPIVYQSEEDRRQIMYNNMVEDMAHRIEDALAIVEADNVFAIKMLASALKDLRSLMNIRDPLDVEEQRARIAKLRSDTRIVETEGEGGIIFMPTMEDRPTPPEDDE